MINAHLYAYNLFSESLSEYKKKLFLIEFQSVHAGNPNKFRLSSVTFRWTHNQKTRIEVPVLLFYFIFFYMLELGQITWSFWASFVTLTSQAMKIKVVLICEKDICIFCLFVKQNQPKNTAKFTSRFITENFLSWRK